jgi:hypothetical protein
MGLHQAIPKYTLWAPFLHFPICQRGMNFMEIEEHVMILRKMVLGLSFLGLVNSQSCTSQQLGTAAVVVAAGAAVGAAILIGGSSSGTTYPTDPTTVTTCREESVCSTYYDYYVNRRESCRVENVCRETTENRRRYLKALNEGGYEAIVASLANNAKLESVVDVTTLAKSFDLSHDSALKLADALNESRAGNLAKLESLGISSRDLGELAMLRLPSQESIDRLARSLDQYPVLTSGMLSRMIIKGREYQKALEAKN